MVSEQIPALTTIYLNPTDRCNLTCMHCWINPSFAHDRFTPTKRQDSELTPDEIENIVKQSIALGLKSIKLTGGEPFLRSDIYDIIKILKKYKLYVHIEANGTLIDKAGLRFLKALRVDRLSISVDSPTPEVHDNIRGIKGAFERTKWLLESLTTSRISREIIMSLLKENIDDIEDLITFAKKMKVNNIKLNMIIPTGRGKYLYKKNAVPSIEELIELNRMLERKHISERSIPVHLSIPPAFKSIRSLVMDGCANCNILNILGILSNGDVSICGIGRTEKALVLGNVRVKPIREIWHHDNFINLLRSHLPQKIKGICLRCIHRNTCIGFCRANAYSVSQDVLAPYWFCEEAKRKRIFPNSRLL